MDERDLDALLVYGDGGFHRAKTFYLTNYTPPFSTYLSFFADPDEANTLFVGISNHLQYAREVSEVTDVRLLLPDPPAGVVERLREADAHDGRIGIVSDDPRYNPSIPHPHYRAFEDDLDADIVDVSAAYTRLISVASEREQDRLRRAGEIMDEAMVAMEEAAEPGVSEQDLDRVLRETVREAGASLGSNFITTAPMEGAEPGEPITWHKPSARRLEAGDILTTEISTDYRGYLSQIHRPYAVGRPPTETYADLFARAEEAYERSLDALQPGNTARDVYEAMAPIEDSEYKIYDVMAHGYGGAYRHPFVGVEESNYWPGAEDSLTAEWTFEPGMIVVTQPNVVTRDETACLQFGTTVIIQENGPEVVHEYPPEFRRI